MNRREVLQGMGAAMMLSAANGLEAQTTADGGGPAEPAGAGDRDVAVGECR